MARTIYTHPSRSISFTSHAQERCEYFNSYMRSNPNSSLRQMYEWYKANPLEEDTWWGAILSFASMRRYYYGIHSHNSYNNKTGPNNFTQVRLGARIAL